MISPWSGRGGWFRDGLPVSFHLCVLPKRAIHPQCIEQIARINPSFLVPRANRLCDPLHGVIVYVSGGGSHHWGSRHPSPKFCPIQPSQEAKRWEEDRRNRTFLSGKYLPVWGGGRWAKYPRSHTLPQLPKLGDPSRCCGQPRVTEIINHSLFFFYTPEKRTQPALPSYHLRIGACLSRNPRHAMRNEGSGD